MSADANNALLKELRSYEPEDNILKTALEETWVILNNSTMLENQDFEILLYNPQTSTQELKSSKYSTQNCKALLFENIIVLNQDFLIEIESAIRAFELSKELEFCQYINSDQDLFSLTDRISSDPYKYVYRIRKTINHLPIDEEYIIKIIALTFLFFIGHEIGHLVHKEDERSFTQFVSPDAELENKITNAIVKLHRHADEFYKYGFDLEKVRATDFAEGIEKNIVLSKKELGNLDTKHTIWFENEEKADDFGKEILLEYIAGIGDDIKANFTMYQIVRGIFAMGLYSWYKDLHTFIRLIGLKWESSRSLAFNLSTDRRNYIYAAALFGEVHSFTLLRAHKIIEASIMSRSNVYDKNVQEPHLKGINDPDETFILDEVVVRDYLIRSMMDTAVKIAYFGTATGWLFKKYTPEQWNKPFFIHFESVNVAMNRIKRMLNY